MPLCPHYSRIIIYLWKHVYIDVNICLKHLLCLNWLRIRSIKAELILFDIETRWRSRQRFCVVTLHTGDNFLLFFWQDALISHWGILFNSVSPCASQGLPICNLPSGQDSLVFSLLIRGKSYRFYLLLEHFLCCLSFGSILCTTFY